MTAVGRLLAALAGLGLSACGAPPAASTPHAPAPSARGKEWAPARYITTTAWICGRESHDRGFGVTGGRRVRFDDFEIKSSIDDGFALDGGAAMPAWIQGDVRFVFWSGAALYGSTTFDGPLRSLGALPFSPSLPFPMFDGVALSGEATVVVVGAGGALRPSRLPSLATGAAIDARHGVLLTTFGRAFFTEDAGATLVDLSRELPGPTSIEMRDGTMVAALADGDERAIDAAGKVSAAPEVFDEDDIDPWPFKRVGLVGALLRSGVELPDGGAVITQRGFVGRVDLERLHATSVAALPSATTDEECEAFSAGAAILVACLGKGRATVFDVTGSPRLERTFQREPSARFVGDTRTGALGFTGACLPPTLGDAEEREPSSPRIFCVRREDGAWIEHRLPDENVVGWIPRRFGGATAVVQRSEDIAPTESDRAERRGLLRVVRLFQSEPFGAAPNAHELGDQVVLRNASIDADDSLEFWAILPSAEPTVAVLLVDDLGHVRVRPLPSRASSVAASGARALAETPSRELFQTLDFGRTWTRVGPAPSTTKSPRVACGRVACAVDDLIRVGWGASAGAASVVAPVTNPSPPSTEAVSEGAKLVCRFDAPAEARAVPGSYDFGLKTPPATDRAGVPLGDIGVLFPPQDPLRGEVELGWIEPFDPAARLHRAKLPIARAPTSDFSAGTETALLLSKSEKIDVVATVDESDEPICYAPMLAFAGVARPIGGCVARGSLGVDLGERLVFARQDGSNLGIDLRGRAPRGSSASVGHVELETPRPQASPVFGVGIRGDEAVIVLGNRRGEASTAPVDPLTGTLGVDRPLAPIASLRDGASAACATPAPGEATVLLTFGSEIGLDTRGLPGVMRWATSGVAIVRWSEKRACLDALETRVSDSRFDVSSTYDQFGGVRKLVYRARGGSAIVEIALGSEVRQRVTCEVVASGAGAP